MPKTMTFDIIKSSYQLLSTLFYVNYCGSQINLQVDEIYWRTVGGNNRTLRGKCWENFARRFALNGFVYIIFCTNFRVPNNYKRTHTHHTLKSLRFGGPILVDICKILRVFRQCTINCCTSPIMTNKFIPIVEFS